MPLNLLDPALSAAHLSATLAAHPPRASLPPADDPAWTEAFSRPLLAPLRDQLVRRALDELDSPAPVLDDALYRDFAATGVRLRFEKRYFERRRRLARFALASLVLGDSAPPALHAAFQDAMAAILDEPSWALPAHVKDASGRDPRLIDLFVAQTCDLLAELLCVFKAQLPLGFRGRLLARLRTEVFPAFIEGDFFWRSITNNWNAVCHQGVLGAALALEDDVSILVPLLLRAREGLPRFLEGFGPDGACSEGPAYWDFGFGAFTRLDEQLETRSAGALSLFADAPLMRLIAGYAPALSLAGGRVVNFSDCASETLLRPYTLARLAHALAHPACRDQALANYARIRAEGFDFDDQRTDLAGLLRLFLHAPAMLSEVLPTAPDAAFPSLGLWVARGRDSSGHLWEIAAKAGHNDEHHNHNDIGSFIVSLDGTPLVTEIGRPEYTRDFFSPRRYEFLAARSLGHSLPVVNGHEQAAGRAHEGRLLRAETDMPCVTFEADLAPAYPPAADLASLLRRLVLDKAAGSITWTDEIELRSPGTIESALITHADTVEFLSADQIRLSRDGHALILRVLSGPLRWRRVEPHDYRGHNGEAASCRRLVLAAADGTPLRSAHTTIRITAS